MESIKGIAISKDSTERPLRAPGGAARDKALLIAEAAQSRQAVEIAILEVGALTSLTEVFVLCSATSEPQMKAIFEAVDRTLSARGETPIGVEGQAGNVWLLLDYNDVILHIFMASARAFYNLDRLWGDARRIPFPAAPDSPSREEEEALR